nr:DNA-directed RNA polymerase subunit P [Methanosarcina horonobensis]
MGYKCTRCKQKVEIDYEYTGIRCPYCGHRILVKERPTTIKRIKPSKEYVSYSSCQIRRKTMVVWIKTVFKYLDGQKQMFPVRTVHISIFRYFSPSSYFSEFGSFSDFLI